ncbi:MAG: hypothetical protein ACK5WS_01620 [Alphaproteobacteria bacterium]|jgi:hypothetical protein|nr:hypothetical protein [Candidatus Jidaibacter sp.]
MLDKWIDKESDLKLHILKGAIALSGKKPDEVITLPFCKKNGFSARCIACITNGI